MYRIIIVDDEIGFREGLENAINWQQYGFKIIGTAQDGKEAVGLINDLLPDIVITDIKMPEMDGISLIRILKEDHPGIKTVILSAYDDFKYAQDAILYGVKAYLLKPIREDELSDILKALYREIQKENSRNNENIVEREYLLRGLITDFDTEKINEIVENISALNISNYNRIIVCACTSVKNNSSHDIINDIFQKATSFSGLKDFPMLLYMNQLVIFATDIKNISKSEVSKTLLDFKEYLYNKQPDHLGSRYVFGIGNTYFGLDKIGKSYSEAIYAYNFKYFNDKQDFLFYQDIHVNNEGELQDTRMDQLVKNIIDNIIPTS